MADALTCGVAVCTCNGEKYILEQLRSIEMQSRPVDQVVVSDDASSDGTWNIVNAWKASVASGLRVTLIRNEARLGLTQNLSGAIDLLDTDLVFTSDQDDVWSSTKVEEIATVFDRQPDALLVFTDAVLGDEKGRPLQASLFEELELSRKERHSIQKGAAPEFLIRRNVVTGATTAFRKRLWQLAKPLPRSWMHDAWLAMIAAALGGLSLLDSRTIMYRQHGSNLIGVKKIGFVRKLKSVLWKMNGADSLINSIRGELQQRRELVSRLEALPSASRQSLSVAERSLAFSELRQGFLSAGRRRHPFVVLQLIKGSYFRFSQDWRSDFLRDLLRR